MRTLTVLAACLTVALGKPLEQNDVQWVQVAPPEALQRPLVGDVLPVQGHVVVEKAAPQPQLSKELQLSAPSPDKEEKAAVQVQEVIINEVDKAPQEKQDLAQDNSEIEEEAPAPFEELRVDSQLNEPDVEELQAEQEPQARIIQDILEEEEGGEEQIQDVEDHNDIEEFEQSFMRLEALANEEDMPIQEEEDIYAAPDMKELQVKQEPQARIIDDLLEEEGEEEQIQELEDQQPFMRMEAMADEEDMPIQEEEDIYAAPDMKELQVKQEPQARIIDDLLEEEGEEEQIQGLEDQQPFMRMEALADEEDMPIQEEEGVRSIEAKYDFEQPVMKLEPLTDEEEMPIEEQEHVNPIKARYNFEQPIMKLEPLSEEEEIPIEAQEQINLSEARYNFEQPIMKLEPLTDEEMQRDELLELSEAQGVYEEPIMSLEQEADEGQFMNEEMVPRAAMIMEEDGPMEDALGEPLQPSDEFFPQDEGLMRLEQPEPEDLSPALLSAQNGVPGRRSCPGVVLEGKCFQFFTNPKKASEAEYFCQQSFRGGHLASITCPHVHTELMNLMRRHGGTRRTWIGGLRFLDTGRFVWLDGSLWSYADWLRGEPNDTANVEDCVEVLASGKFNDFTCWEPQAFICSYPYQ